MSARPGGADRSRSRRARGRRSGDGIPADVRADEPDGPGVFAPAGPGAAAPPGPATDIAAGAAEPFRPGRRLGVDVGTVRVGVALSDPTGLLASPLETLRRAKDRSDLDRLAELVVTHGVVGVVVGLPRHLSGASGVSARDASTYASALATRIGDVPVHLVDERLSTVTAASHLRAGGIDSRRQRSVIDQAAAVVILQSYLDAARDPGRRP
jgi:putative Holliday junction resolvase